jgi:hypothetical protein
MTHSSTSSPSAPGRDDPGHHVPDRPPTDGCDGREQQHADQVEPLLDGDERAGDGERDRPDVDEQLFHRVPPGDGSLGR